ncbi:DUF1364 domain-containing protein [Aggregatibacter actinomycetemcomitans]|uniref:DUF1364 domain-containing protein n=1 Tax=Aggregatibacter actinomycetemcomitans TaxID=714 RepID=UPI001E2A96AF|nr:DUF1364 domain-containing protein [Aggregatibacter actinomycetemcomitans]
MAKVDYRKEAKGRDCQVRLIGVCNHNPETTVLAHIRAAGITGIGQKAYDQLGAWACYNCHMAIDGQTKTNYTRDELERAHLDAVIRTQAILISEGKL